MFSRFCRFCRFCLGFYLGKFERGVTLICGLVCKLESPEVGGHANQARIRTWPRDNSSLWAEDTVAFARQLGLYPAGAPDEASARRIRGAPHPPAAISFHPRERCPQVASY